MPLPLPPLVLLWMTLLLVLFFSYILYAGRVARASFFFLPFLSSSVVR
jgi:hypothetical protein